MIIGHGDIAGVLPQRDDVTFFAAGVSNSRETNPANFRRELDLLLQQPRDRLLVYFSTLSIFYADSPYIRHKKNMEHAVKEHFPGYAIVRLGNITWGANPHTLLNFFAHCIRNNQPFEIRDEYRHLLTKADFLFWLDKIPVPGQTEMSITGKRMLVRDIAARLRDGSLLEYLER
jgi:hypothetical protein